MRLLIVSQYFWPENFRINLVAEELSARGHQVTVLCGTPNYPAGRVFDGYGWFRRTREVWRGVEIVRSVTNEAGLVWGPCPKNLRPPAGFPVLCATTPS